jgi:DNA polymerase-4
MSIPYTNADHVLLKASRDLFNSLYERRLLVRLLGIRFTHLIPGHYQISLFDDTQESINLYQAIDSVKHRFGEGLVQRARGLTVPV